MTENKERKMKAIKGVCMHMCPDKERLWREKEGLLHQFEICEGTEHLRRPKADVNKIIKEFKRSAAGQSLAKPEELRPFAVLLRTVDYLIKRVATRTDVPWAVIYEYMADRLRAVRQDMIIQQLKTEECIPILEKVIRFYIYSSFRLHHKPHSVFDPHLNNIQLQDCLKRLLVLYNEVENNKTIKHRIEMEALYILHNLGSMDALYHSIDLPSELRSDHLIKLAVKTSLAYHHQNFIQFLHCVQQLPFLSLCSAIGHLDQIRRTTLQVMNTAYSSKNCQFPLGVVTKWLMYVDKVKVTKVCEHYGLKADNNFVYFQKGTFNTKIKTFPPDRECLLQEKAKDGDLVSILNGSS